MSAACDDVKTMDVKIMELRDEPDNIRLLLTVLSMICQDIDEIKGRGDEIKDFDLVNYILANALKADKIEAIDLGIVILYLETVDAPSIYF